MLLLAVFTINLAYSSFPVKRSDKAVEVVTDQLTVADVSAAEMVMTTASTDGIDLLGLLFGLLLSLIGVIICYFFFPESLKGSVVGALIGLVLYLIL